MCTFNGSSLILDNVPVTAVFTDACDTAAGGYYDGDWFNCNWSVYCRDSGCSHQFKRIGGSSGQINEC